MLKDLFSNRLFIGALAIFIFCVGGSLLYMQHVQQQSAREMAAHEERLKQLTERETRQPTTGVSSVAAQTEQVGHFHSDGTFHAEPHEPIAAPSDVSKSEVSTENTPPRMEYNAGAGNPPPFEDVPVDLRDFEATKAAMIENINFLKANWHPTVYNREVSIASAIALNIANAANATDLGLYTPEQALELNRLHSGFLEWKGHEPGRTRELREQGYTRKEAIRIAAEETLQRQKQRWGVK